MRSWLLLLATLLSLHPSDALANSLQLLSGDHKEGFTRLVIPIVTGTVWEVEKQGRMVQLKFTQNAPSLDSSRVFDRISKDRIREITINPQGLTLALNCDCNAYAFLHKSNFVVIDIARPGLQLATTQLVDETLTSQPKSSTIAETVPALGRRIERESNPFDIESRDASEVETANRLRSTLFKQIGIAATRGLLQNSASAPDPARPHINPERLLTENTKPKDHALVQQQVQTNLRISSSLDLPKGGAEDRLINSLTQESCPDTEMLEISSWTNDLSFEVQIGQLRDELYGEKDRINSRVALALAQRYLHFGFGAEARQILSLSADLTENHQPLLEVADIIEYKTTRSSQTLAPFVNCDNNAALWAILADKNLAARSEVNANAALRALNEIPIHLRRLIAPLLSEKLLSLGKTDSAAAALRNLERRAEPLPSAAQLSQVKVALKSDSQAGVSQNLEDVIDENSAHSPVALVMLVDNMLSENQPIEPETAELAAAYAKELGDTPLGSELNRAHVLALLKSNQFSKAFSEKDAMGSNEQDRLQLNSLILRELTNFGSDLDFMNHSLQQKPHELEALEAADLMSLAQRMLSLGFPLDAQKVLEIRLKREASEDARLLAANVALALDQPFQAQAHLIGLDTPEAMIARAKAKQMAGDFTAAHDLFSQSGSTQDAVETAWLAELWESENLSQDEVFSPLLQVIETPMGEIDAQEGALESYQDVIQESENARMVLNNLLSSSTIARN